MNIKDYITIKEVSELLGVDKTTLRRWDKAGKLKPYRHPLNKYRLYKKADVITVSNEFSGNKKDSVNRCINDFFIFFNTEVRGSLFDYFLSNEVQERINKELHLLKIYTKEHYIKTYNLFLSIMLLSAGSKGHILPDEAKIVFRSLFEHICNFIYINTTNDKKITEQLIARFNDYANIALHKYEVDFIKDWDSKRIEENEITKQIYQEVKKYYEKYKIEDRLCKYKQKYDTNNINSWHGIQITQFFEQIFKNTSFGNEFRFFKKYYTDTNCYVHCNIMDFMNKEGVFVGNLRNEESLEVTYKATFMALAYIEGFYQILNINIRDNYGAIYDKFNILAERYHKIMRAVNND